MQLFILRHGIAEEVHAGQPDSDRTLTGEGKRKLRSVLKLARQVHVHPTLILSSPYKRAVQSAEIAAEVLEYTGRIEYTDILKPNGDPETVWDELRVHQHEPQVLISGHDPLFSSLVGFLLNCPNLQVDFKKGAIVRIDFDRFAAGPRGVLKWMLVAKLAK